MAKIWAVGGGKGGVGKSFVTANLASQLAINGKKIVVIDLDLGGANVHTCLGVSVPPLSISDFVQKRVATLEEICVPTPVPGLSLISGANDSLTIANLKYSQKLKIIAAFKKLDADYVILDLGAGTTFNTLDFYLHADLGILVVVPEPTSVENAYRFIKSAFFRMIRMCDDIPGVRKIIDQAIENRDPGGNQTPAQLIEAIIAIDKDIGELIKTRIESFNPQLILNQIRNENDVDIGFSIKTVCQKYFGIRMDYIGFLEYDHSVWQAVRKKRVLSVDSPNSVLVNHFQNMLKRLTGNSPRSLEVRL